MGGLYAFDRWLPFPRRPAAGFYVFFQLRFSSEDVVVMLRETVGFIPDVLQHFQPSVVAL
jgi:hypothetical protein